MTHLCRRNDEFLLVTVDYRAVQSDLAVDHEKQTGARDPSQAATSRTLTTKADASTQKAREKRRSYKTPVRRLTEAQARPFVREHFTEYPSNADNMFNGSEWTFAIIGQAQPLRAETAAKHPVLRPQVLDRVALLASQPACD